MAEKARGPEWGPQRWWWLVTYSHEGQVVKVVEWLSAGEADVKVRATGRAVQRVRVTVADEEVQG